MKLYEPIQTLLPVAPSQALVAEVSALGPVAHIVAPDWIHYVHVPAWRE